MKTSSLASLFGENKIEKRHAEGEVDPNLWPSVEKRFLSQITELENQVKLQNEQATKTANLLQNKPNTLIKNLEEITFAKLEISDLKEKVEHIQKENASSKTKVSELTRKLQNAERESSIHEFKFNSIFEERS